MRYVKGDQAAFDAYVEKSKSEGENFGELLKILKSLGPEVEGDGTQSYQDIEGVHPITEATCEYCGNPGPLETFTWSHYDRETGPDSGEAELCAGCLEKFSKRRRTA